MNIETREVKEAELVKSNAVVVPGKGVAVRKRIDCKDGMFYAVALNSKNALRHLDQALVEYQRSIINE